VLLWVAVGGFAALVVWEVCRVVAGHRRSEGFKKVAGKAAFAFKAIVFVTLAISAATVAAGSGSSSGSGGARARVLRRLQHRQGRLPARRRTLRPGRLVA
jgi:hypothetical protein